MIEFAKYQHPEVVDWSVVSQFKAKLQAQKFYVPVEVEQFIQAMDRKLGDFAQFGKERQYIDGRELLLCVDEWQGEKIDADAAYPIDVPKMQAVDNYTTMHRIFSRKGKKGLIDYCKAKVKGTELQRVLEILTVEVFHEARPEFKKVLNEIDLAKKITNWQELREFVKK